MRSLRGEMFLLLTAFIWGTAFVAQSMGMDHIGAFTFNAARSFVGAFAVFIIVLVNDKIQNKDKSIDKKHNNKLYIRGGIICGLILFAASGFQQVGMQYTTAGKAGFITTLYIILVPIIGVFLKKKAGAKVWISTIIAIVGIYLLSIKEGLTIGIGDTYVICCALVFSFHIIVVDKYSSITDVIKMSCVQLIVCGVSSLAVAIIFENINIDGLIKTIGPILYTGVLSSGVAYTCQMIGQKDTKPAVASILMSLEAVFAALGGWIILNERLSIKELIGCVLVFIAVIITQIPDKREYIEDGNEIVS